MPPAAAQVPFHPGVRVEWHALPRAGGKSYAVVWLGSEPVNSMTLELWTALSDTLDFLEADPKTSGVVFASELKKPIFTAGNDIKELYTKTTTKARYTKFWRVQTSFLCRLLRSPLATACAIRGACPAGGCAVALCCDYRVQSLEGTFGLNEVQLGIPVPKYWGKLFVNTAAHAPSAELALHRGALLAPHEAQRMGLVHETVPTSAIMAATERAMETLLRLPDNARAATKMNVREEFSREWEGFIEEEARKGWEMLREPEVENALGGVIQRLSSKGKGKVAANTNGNAPATAAKL
jgi:3,2-trans-enoyl-CoA isomerase